MTSFPQDTQGSDHATNISSLLQVESESSSSLGYIPKSHPTTMYNSAIERSSHCVYHMDGLEHFENHELSEMSTPAGQSQLSHSALHDANACERSQFNESQQTIFSILAREHHLMRNGNSDSNDSIFSDTRTSDDSKINYVDMLSNNGFINMGHLINRQIPDALLNLIQSDRVYKCTDNSVYTYIQSCCVDLTSSDIVSQICTLLDRHCFLIVDWTRQSVYFRRVEIDDQIRLLKSAWLEMLIVDMMWKQTSYPENHDTLSIVTWNNQVLDLSLIRDESIIETVSKLKRLLTELKGIHWDYVDYLAMKQILLFDPDVFGLSNPDIIEHIQEMISGALMQYNCTFYPTMPQKFSGVLLKLPFIRLAGCEFRKMLYAVATNVTAHNANGDNSCFVISDGCLLGEMLNLISCNSPEQQPPES